MFQILNIIQDVGIVILALEFLFVAIQKPSAIQRDLILLVTNIMIVVVTYSFEMRAESLEEALLASKLAYIGKPFIVVCMLLLITDCFRIHVKKWIIAAFFVLQSMLSLTVFTSSLHSLYYTSYEFVKDGVFPHLVVGHGILYNFFTADMFLMILLLAGICIRQIAKKTGKERYQAILFSAIIGIGAFFYILTLLDTAVFHIFEGYDISLLGYILAASLFSIAFFKFNLLDTITLAKEQAVDFMSGGLWVFDDSGKMIYHNTAAEDFGISDEIENIYAGEKPYFRDDKVYSAQKINIESDGISYGYMYLMTDVTKNFKYEQMLREEKKRADEANEAKSLFLSRMSHEIRTPINAVIGMDEMILRESRDNHIKEYAMDIQTAGNTLLSLINDILDLSKIESGKMQIIPADYELAPMLHDLSVMTQMRAGAKDITFKADIQRSLPRTLFGDDMRLKQVLTNILTNAVKYTQQGEVVLRVSGRRNFSNIILSFEVSDTGIGIKQEDMPRLFGEFERIEEERNRNVEGTGLGMNITMKLLKLMGSKLRVESEYGKGSIFRFDIRQRIVDAREIGDFELHMKEQADSYKYSKSFTAPDAAILTVDDNLLNLRVVSGLLKDTQVEVTTASSGVECLKLASEKKFDLILLDHMMPEMDGIETFKRLRSMAYSPNAQTPVFALTANAVAGSREMYLKEGFSGFLTKPIDPTALEKTVMENIPPEKLCFTKHDDDSPGYTETKAPKDEKEDNYSDLPVIEGLDWDYAKAHLSKKSLMIESLRVFRLTVTAQSDRLGEIYERVRNVRDDKAYSDYRVQVHAMKSTAATVGIVLLSGMANRLEAAAREHEGSVIRRMHSVFTESWDSYEQKLSVLFPEEADADPKSFALEYKNEVKAQLELLKSAMMFMDTDGADEAIGALASYRYPDSIEKILEELKEAVMMLDADKAVNLSEKLLKKIQ